MHHQFDFGQEARKPTLMLVFLETTHRLSEERVKFICKKLKLLLRIFDAKMYVAKNMAVK